MLEDALAIPTEGDNQDQPDLAGKSSGQYLLVRRDNRNGNYDILDLTQVLLAGDGTDQVANLFGLDLISQDNGSETRTLLANGLGSVRVKMVDNSVKTVSTYSPYGKMLEKKGDSDTVYGFTGERYDNITGLLYLRARYNSAGLVTFTSKVSWQGGCDAAEDVEWVELYREQSSQLD